MDSARIQFKFESVVRCRGKIVDGRVAKIAKERALLEQPFVKDSNKTVAEVIKEAIAAIGENIKVGFSETLPLASFTNILFFNILFYIFYVLNFFHSSHDGSESSFTFYTQRMFMCY